MTKRKCMGLLFPLVLMEINNPRNSILFFRARCSLTSWCGLSLTVKTGPPVVPPAQVNMAPDSRECHLAIPHHTLLSHHKWTGKCSTPKLPSLWKLLQSRILKLHILDHQKRVADHVWLSFPMCFSLEDRSFASTWLSYKLLAVSAARQAFLKGEKDCREQRSKRVPCRSVGFWSHVRLSRTPQETEPWYSERSKTSTWPWTKKFDYMFEIVEIKRDAVFLIINLFPCLLIFLETFSIQELTRTWSFWRWRTVRDVCLILKHLKISQKKPCHALLIIVK